MAAVATRFDVSCLRPVGGSTASVSRHAQHGDQRCPLAEVVQAGRRDGRERARSLGRRRAEPHGVDAFPDNCARTMSPTTKASSPMRSVSGRCSPLSAAQERFGSIRRPDRRAASPSVGHTKWTWRLSPGSLDLRVAPTPESVVPGFMEKYRRNFWNGSHWQITDGEFAALQAAIISAGEGREVPPPPWSS